MLENTLSIFTTASVFFYIKGHQRKELFFVCISGLMLALGFLTKGFVTFFPLVLPFLFWFFQRQTNKKTAFIETSILILFSVGALAMLFLYPEARENIDKYFYKQVVNSLKNVITVNSRFKIVERMFLEILPSLIIASVFMIYAFIKKISIKLPNKDFQLGSIFICLGLSGVLPIMISLKQSGFYILATFPFFAIGISILISPLTNSVFDGQKKTAVNFKILKITSVLVFAIGLVMTLTYGKKIGRDEVKLNAVKEISSYIDRNSIISIDPSLFNDWTLHGYFQRHKNISLDADLKKMHTYLLRSKIENSNILRPQYSSVKLITDEYQLYKLK
jgi:4-amino-4-deoxy-L-arabinose transferase-like glycosyltransferase